VRLKELPMTPDRVLSAILSGPPRPGAPAAPSRGAAKRRTPVTS